MEKAIVLLIWWFLFTLFGWIFNQLMYWLWFISRLSFNLLYFTTDLFWLSIIGVTIINIMFYSLVFWFFHYIFKQFTN